MDTTHSNKLHNDNRALWRLIDVIFQYLYIINLIIHLFIYLFIHSNFNQSSIIFHIDICILLTYVLDNEEGTTCFHLPSVCSILEIQFYGNCLLRHAYYTSLVFADVFFQASSNWFLHSLNYEVFFSYCWPHPA